MLPKLFFTLLYLVIGLVYASNVTEQVKRNDEHPQHPLEIRQDMSVAVPEYGNQNLWSGFATFAQDVKLEKEYIAAFAQKASKLMREDWDKRKIGSDKRPSIMTALQVDNQIFFASSMKSKSGTPFIYKEKTTLKGNSQNPKADGSINDYVPGELKSALKEVQKNGPSRNEPNQQHRFDASCGEVMSTYAWLLKHGGPKGTGLKNRKPQPNIVSWQYTAKGKYDELYDPCGEPPKEEGKDGVWGCNRLCQEMGYNVIPTDTTLAEDKDLPKLAKEMEQQPLSTGADKKDEGECDGDEGDQKGKKKATRDMRYGERAEQVEDDEAEYDDEHEDKSDE